MEFKQRWLDNGRAVAVPEQVWRRQSGLAVIGQAYQARVHDFRARRCFWGVGLIMFAINLEATSAKISILVA